MKLCVVLDRDGNIISLHELAPKTSKDKPAAPSCQVRPAAHADGKILSLDAPPGLKGMSLVEIHDSVYVDLSGREPVLKHKRG